MDGFDSSGNETYNGNESTGHSWLHPGRLDRKIEIPLPNEQARLEILKIHASPVNKGGDVDYEAIVNVVSDLFCTSLS